jgi:hypothetical protein
MLFETHPGRWKDRYGEVVVTKDPKGKMWLVAQHQVIVSRHRLLSAALITANRLTAKD